MFARTAVVIATLGLAASVTGCSQVAGAACASGVGRPITAERVLKELRAQGFTVRSTGDCGGAADIVADISNHGNDDIDQEGHVGCAVRRRPIYLAKYGPGFHTDLPKTEAMTAHWLLDNVECALYARSDRAKELARLRTAMLAMKP